MIDFTFKKGTKSTGLASVGAGTPSTTIKYAGKECGCIVFNDSWGSPHGGIKIRLMFEGAGKDNPNCPWRWVTVKKTFGSEEDAREYMQVTGRQFLEHLHFHND
jgi:hypothetical protein